MIGVSLNVAVCCTKFLFILLLIILGKISPVTDITATTPPALTLKRKKFASFKDAGIAVREAIYKYLYLKFDLSLIIFWSHCQDPPCNYFIIFVLEFK